MTVWHIVKETTLMAFYWSWELNGWMWNRSARRRRWHSFGWSRFPVLKNRETGEKCIYLLSTFWVKRGKQRAFWKAISPLGKAMILINEVDLAGWRWQEISWKGNGWKWQFGKQQRGVFLQNWISPFSQEVLSILSDEVKVYLFQTRLFFHYIKTVVVVYL